MNPLLYLRWLGRKLHLGRDNIDRAQTINSLRESIAFSGVNLWILVIAIFMASLGLNVNSTAVIIGAMLISPLMGPIMGIGLGLGTLDLQMVRTSFRNWVAAFLISLITSWLYFLVTPYRVAGNELLARTYPTVYDVLIAFAGGLAGILAGSSRLRQSNVIPGVAIATALMPPICTAGYSLANARWTDLAGALYLFLINSVFISLATYLVVRGLKFPLRTYVDAGKQKKWRSITSTIAILVIAPSIYLTYNLVKNYVVAEKAEKYLEGEITSADRYVLNRKIVSEGGKSVLKVAVLGRPIDSTDYAALQAKLSDYGLPNLKLELTQGFQDTSRQSLLFDRLSQLELSNSKAITQAFSELDTLVKRYSAVAVSDSTQAQLATESKILLPTLSRFFIAKEAFFRLDSARFDTLVHVYASFQKMPTNAEEQRYLQWLKARLRKQSITLEKKLDDSP